jgi:hypothetical protein
VVSYVAPAPLPISEVREILDRAPRLPGRITVAVLYVGEGKGPGHALTGASSMAEAIEMVSAGRHADWSARSWINGATGEEVFLAK